MGRHAKRGVLLQSSWQTTSRAPSRAEKGRKAVVPQSLRAPRPVENRDERRGKVWRRDGAWGAVRQRQTPSMQASPLPQSAAARQSEVTSLEVRQ